MESLSALAAVVALVAVATALGAVLRSRSGRLRAVTDGEGKAAVPRVDVESISGTAAGANATLLQFSTALCGPCRGARTLLSRLAQRHPGVTHVEVDVTDRPDLSTRFGILQTPTILLLDHSGIPRARIGGAPRPAELEQHLDRLLEARHVAHP